MQFLEHNPHTLKTLVSVIAALILALCVSACGYRGPLYLPDEPAINDTVSTDSAEEEQDTEDKKEEQDDQ